ncbi:ABC transporter permease [Polaromonas jejuensis]|uniref:ABC transporter permease n=1 Tax=Polaromonas jejuensis TaxID=457502 RepID=UPI000A68B773
MSTRGSRLQRMGYLLPLLVFVVVVFDLPVLRMLSLSFQSDAGVWGAYQELFSSSAYLLVILNTFKMALATALACGVFGYVLAYWIYTLQAARLRTAVLALVGLSFWISILVRTYAWIVVLGNNGIVNRLLLDLGLVESPLPLIYNELGVLVGTVNLLLPLVVLPLYANMSGVDRRLTQAARSLGAGEARVFWTVFFPLTLPALLAGTMLVFILTLGFLVTPAILGGNRVPMIATVLDSLINVLSDWQLAAALSSILLLMTLGFYMVHKQLTSASQAGGRA